jgi:hypothetical protein
LSLTSTGPMTVTINGGQNPQDWLVALGLSDVQGTGTLDAVLESAGGGSFVASLPVSGRYVFAPQSDLELLDQGLINGEDVQLRLLDMDFEGIPPVNISWAGPQPFSTSEPTDGTFFCPNRAVSDPFYPGVVPELRTNNCTGQGCHGGPDHTHCICAPHPPPGLCTYARIGSAGPFFGDGPCPLPLAGKLLVPCPVGPANCPQFVVAIRRVTGGGFCVGFYNTVPNCP